jgi:hypothetical protein
MKKLQLLVKLNLYFYNKNYRDLGNIGEIMIIIAASFRA